jgi:octaprenyl-diphosphate synthase
MTGVKQKLLSMVAGDLEKIETALENNLTPHLALVRETAGHLMFAGGKRLRPLLIVLSARICGHEDEFIYKFASIFEFLHTATLLHDDVIDGATVRRGKPVAHAIYGAPVTILTGDFLLARALRIAAESNSMRIIDVVSSMTEEISQGEIHQLIKKGDVTFSEDEYMSVIRRKTGVLIQGACKTGAILADALPDTEEALSIYGDHLGLVFQIADDILDYTAESGELGKTVGADLREGKITLPVIHALREATDPDRRQMESIIADTDFSESQFQVLIGLINKYGGIEYSMNAAAVHVKAAMAALDIFKASRTKEILEMMAQYALNRRV